ncbi:MAG: hypothetical protein K2X82_33655 [Gemmataceae bacterium]|nr:hypothetical protein [Gemmataceae bacterium]
MAAIPSLVALWLVDDVTWHPTSGRPTLHGSFNRIILLPGATEYETPFTVFFSATDVRARSECVLRLTDLSDLEVVYSRPIILDVVGPAEVVDMTVRVNTVPIPGPGEYAWDLFLDPHLLGCTRMTVAAADGAADHPPAEDGR